MTDICFDADLVRRYGGRQIEQAPFPPIADFDPKFSENAYRRRVKQSNELPIPLALALSVEAPRFGDASDTESDRFLSHFQNEVSLEGRLFDKDRPLQGIHLGPGAAATLDTPQLERILECLDVHFDARDLCETGLSADLGSCDADEPRLAALGLLGFDRVALISQPDRRSDSSATDRLVVTARQSGFRFVSADLGYGLPEQTPVDLASAVDRLLASRPNEVRLVRDRQAARPQAGLSTDELAAYSLAVKRLTLAGYEHLGLDHFVLPDDQRLAARLDGNLRYGFMGFAPTPPRDVVALGAGSSGAVHGCRVLNYGDLDRYCSLLDAGRLPIRCGVETGGDHRLRTAIVEGLLCRRSLDFEQLEILFGTPIASHLAPELEALEPMLTDGLVRTTDTGIDVSPRGELLLAAIVQVFTSPRHRAGSQPGAA